MFNFDFLKYRYFFISVSAALILAIFGLFVYKWQTKGQAFNYSIEFQGGTQFLLKFKTPIKADSIVAILEKNGFSGASAREFAENEILVRIKEYSSEASKLGTKTIECIKVAVPDNSAEILQSDSIGAGIGQEIRWKSTRAILISLVLMLLYIAFRFWSFGFALGAVVALAHDAIMILGFFLLFDWEMSANVIGAILAILGYSVNDTIVIFAAERTNIKSMSGASIVDIVNLSLNQTLTRTLLTSFATLLTVLAMFFLGGPALREFSAALMIGIVFGTYSSIYIASPVMMLFHKGQE